MRRELGREEEKDVLRLLRDFMETRGGLANSMVGCSVVWCGVVQCIGVYFIALQYWLVQCRGGQSQGGSKTKNPTRAS